MMSHFYSPLHHMYGSLHAPRYPVDQKYPPPPLLEQKYVDPAGGGKYHQYPTGGEDQSDLRYGTGEKYPESGDSKMHGHKPISSSPSLPPHQQPLGGSYAERHFLSSPVGGPAAGGEDVKPLDKLQLHHQLHQHQDKSSESSDYESKESAAGGGGYTPEQAGSAGLYSPGGGGYYQPSSGELGAGGDSPDLAHPAYGGYSTTGAFGGLTSPLVRPRSNKNKSQAGETQSGKVLYSEEHKFRSTQRNEK